MRTNILYHIMLSCVQYIISNILNTPRMHRIALKAWRLISDVSKFDGTGESSELRSTI